MTTESWQRFPTIFFSISLAPTNIVVSGHTKSTEKHGKLKKFLRKNTETSAEERGAAPRKLLVEALHTLAMNITDFHVNLDHMTNSSFVFIHFIDTGFKFVIDN